MDSCKDPGSDQPYPEPPPGVPVQLADAGNSAIASWLIERINIDVDLLTKHIIELSEKKQGILNTVQDIETWLHERHKVILVHQHGIRTDINTKALIQEVKATCEAAAATQINPTRRGAALEPGEITTENVIGSFYLYVKDVKAMIDGFHDSAESETPTTLLAEQSLPPAQNSPQPHPPIQSSESSPLSPNSPASTLDMPGFRVPNLPAQ